MSLSTRLSAFFLVTLALALGGFSTTLYFLARIYMIRHLDEHIMSDLDALTAAVEDGPARVKAWEARRPAVGLDPEVEQIFWVIYDEQGRSVARSRNAAREDFSGNRGLATVVGHAHASTTNPDGRRWRLALRRLEAEEPESFTPPPQQGGPKAAPSWGHPALVLMAGTSLAPLEATLRSLAAVLVVLSAVLWGMAAAAGRLIARRALSPMTRMAEAARVMTTIDRTQQHLPSPETDDELDHLAESFNGLLDRLNEALEREKRFTGEASHQLRTPLTALIGEIEVARRRVRTVEEYREILDEIHGDALRLRQIVEAMLFLARADAESSRPDLQGLDLSAWLPGHLAQWSGHERAADIQAVGISGRPAPILAHPPLLGQLLDNLIENACKYSPRGTPIRVWVDREPGFVGLAVEDQGRGIEPEDQPHVFKPFYRAEQARRHGDPGVGLGLAVAQRIVDAFGGAIEVASEPGRGSRFRVRFPEAELPAPELTSVTSN